jgi:DNA-binding GntR family transcriptional regulator
MAQKISGSSKLGPKINQASFADQARTALKTEIITGVLKPGQRIEIADYAERWSISPTPLRDALKSLEVSGFVEISPRRGIFVSQLDLTAMRELLEVRACLESAAAAAAAKQIPKEIAIAARDAYVTAGNFTKNRRTEALKEVDSLVHKLVRDHCGNSRLQSMMVALWDQFEWTRHIMIKKAEAPYEMTLPEHVLICECLIAGDSSGAEKAMQDHLVHAFNRLFQNPRSLDA